LVEPEAARAVLQALAQANDLVVVDLPRSLDEAAVEALSVSTVTLVIVPAEVRATAAASQTTAAARLVAGDLRAVVRMPSPGGLAPGEVADVVGLPLAGVIGPDRRMSVAAEHGEPPGTSPRGTLPGFCRPFLDSLIGGRGFVPAPRQVRHDFQAAA
jgi:septum formation inhibitor-activating ATPase MinD